MSAVQKRTVETEKRVVKRYPGRQPTLYSKEMHKKIVDAIRKGASIKDAGILAGLGKDTLDTWLYNGRHEPEKYPHFAKLSDDLETCKAEKRLRLVEQIDQTALSGAPGTWQAAAWRLERDDPKNWGRKDKVEVQNTGGPQTQLNMVVLVDEGIREQARDLLRRVAGPGATEIAPGPNLALGSGDSMHVEAGEAE